MSEINWYEEDVLLAVDGASRDFLLAMAHQVIAEAKPNMPVDTGFLRNSDYVVGAGENTFTPKRATLKSRKTGQTAEHETVPSVPSPVDNEVIAGFAADYAVYQEIEQGFLHRALQSVAQQAQGIIQTAGKKHFND